VTLCGRDRVRDKMNHIELFSTAFVKKFSYTPDTPDFTITATAIEELPQLKQSKITFEF
jgi:hypothetical protein